METLGSSVCYSMTTEDTNEFLTQINSKWDKTVCFPGPQPISIERKHLVTLKKNIYHVSDKTNGTRYALACLRYKNKPVCVVINRNLESKMVKLKCPKRCYEGTLLDCELVNEKGKWILLVFDCILMCGQNVSKEKYSDRLEFAKTFTTQYTKTDNDNFTVRVKNTINFKNMKTDSNIVESVDYDTDGYIFTPEIGEILLGTHNFMFKWKKQMDNTIDFGLDSKKNLYLQKGGALVKTRKQFIYNGEEFDNTDMIIVECRNVDMDINKWEFVKIREDKNKPNAIHVFRKTFTNITENIKANEFLN